MSFQNRTLLINISLNVEICNAPADLRRFAQLFLCKDANNSSVVDLYGKVNEEGINIKLRFSEACLVLYAIVSSNLSVTASAHFVMA
jgi:hypothetical protein